MTGFVIPNLQIRKPKSRKANRLPHWLEGSKQQPGPSLFNPGVYVCSTFLLSFYGQQRKWNQDREGSKSGEDSHATVRNRGKWVRLLSEDQDSRWTQVRRAPLFTFTCWNRAGLGKEVTNRRKSGGPFNASLCQELYSYVHLWLCPGLVPPWCCLLPWSSNK